MIAAALLATACGAAGGEGPREIHAAQDDAPAAAEATEPTGYECLVQTIQAPIVDAPPDLISGQVVVQDRYRFDEHGRFIELERTIPSLSTRSTQRMEYDEHGRVVARHSEDQMDLGADPERQTVAVRYVEAEDPAHQVVEAHDLAPNVVQERTWTFDDQGRVIRVELVRRALVAAEGAEPGDPPQPFEQRAMDRCEWDASGRLASWWHGAQHTTFEYRGGTHELVATHHDAVEGQSNASTLDLEWSPEGYLDAWPRSDEARVFAHDRLVGDCADIAFRGCSAAFAPAPPPAGGGVRHRVLPLR